MGTRWPNKTNRRVVDIKLFVLLEGLTEGMESMSDQIFQRTYFIGTVGNQLGSSKTKVRTICEAFVVLLQISLRALTPGTDRDSIVLIRVP